MEPRAVLYCRLSKEDIDKLHKGDDSESIKNQRMLLQDFAKKKGFVVIETYIDEDYSGLDRKRPSFNEMLKAAGEKKFDVILCKSQSRFTRDMEISERYLHNLFPLWGIRFIGVVDDVDTDIKGNKKSRQINALINEWYVEELSENIRAVFRHKMEQGQFLGAFAPYGYQKERGNRHKLEVDQEAAAVVQNIYTLFLEGYEIAEICRNLQKKGVLTPTAYKKSLGLSYENGNANKEGQIRWSKTTVKRILTNPVYIGTLVQGREKKVSYKSKKVVVVPKEEWVVVENNHMPIICKQQFLAVQDMWKK